jgi:predicted dehydrogenase
MGDIGSHAENLVATVTGLQVEALCADLTAFGPGRRLEDDASVLLRLEGGARGVLTASQVAVGCENGLRLRVFGERGALDWRQEEPNVLLHAPLDAPPRTVTRNAPGLSEAARRACRLPPGHPEGFIEAFANLYLGMATDLRTRLATGAPASAQDADYPRIEAGARGVRFIERTLESARGQAKWVSMPGR